MCFGLCYKYTFIKLQSVTREYIHRGGVMSDLSINETLYYQWLINNNSSSTMLNAISGNTSDNSSLSSLSAISSLYGLSTYSDIEDLSSLGTLGSLSGLTGIDSTGSVSSFSSILESYLTNMDSTVESNATETAEMVEKLESVLEEANKSEDTNSLTYQTVQELYEYFVDKTSAKAVALMKNSSEEGAADAATASSDTAIQQSGHASYIDEMNEAAMNGQEFDFSSIDEVVDSVFAEAMPLS